MDAISREELRAEVERINSEYEIMKQMFDKTSLEKEELKNKALQIMKKAKSLEEEKVAAVAAAAACNETCVKHEGELAKYKGTVSMYHVFK